MPPGVGGEPTSASDDATRRLEQVAARAETERAEALNAYSEAEAEGRNRRFVTWAVIGTWAASVGACCVAAFVVLLRAPVGDAAAAQAAVNNLSELLKVGVLPLTGIVVGYYLSRGR